MVADHPIRPVVEPTSTQSNSDAVKRTTAKARKLMAEHGIDIAEFRGLDVVRERDVLEWISPPGHITR